MPTCRWLPALDSCSRVAPASGITRASCRRSTTWSSSPGYDRSSGATASTPPLPTWLLWLPVQAFGWSAWTVYVVGASTTVTSLLLMWRLVARLRRAPCSGRIAGGGLRHLLQRTTQLLQSQHRADAAERLQRRGDLGSASEVEDSDGGSRSGLCLGLGALAKYQIVVTYVCVIAFAVHSRFWGWRAALRAAAGQL